MRPTVIGAILAIVIIAGVLVLKSGLGSIVSSENKVSNNFKERIVGDFIENMIPDTDVSGKDLDNVPRPDNFVRALYSENIDNYTVSVSVLYIYKGDKYVDAYNFYIREMDNFRWILKNEKSESINEIKLNGVTVAVSNQTTLTFNKNGNETVEIQIFLAKLGNKEITGVSVNYHSFKNKNHSGSTVSEEPRSVYKPVNREPIIEIKQYPGAIFYDYNYQNILGIITMQEYYFIDDNSDNVFNFYNTNIPENYTLISSTNDANELGIIYNKDSTVISLKIKETNDGTILEVTKVIYPQLQ